MPWKPDGGGILYFIFFLRSDLLWSMGVFNNAVLTEAVPVESFFTSVKAWLLTHLWQWDMASRTESKLALLPHLRFKVMSRPANERHYGHMNTDWIKSCHDSWGVPLGGIPHIVRDNCTAAWAIVNLHTKGNTMQTVWVTSVGHLKMWGICCNGNGLVNAYSWDG